MLRPGDTIEYLADVSSPPNQKGIRGQTKVIDRDIPIWTAKFLLDGGKVRPFDPASPLELESATADKEEETREVPDGPAKIPGPDSAAGTAVVGHAVHKAKEERRIRTDGRKTISEKNQAGDPGPEKPGPEGRA